MGATTSPAKIIPLGSDEQFKGLNTPFQFLLKYKKHSAQERRFRRARKSRKTTLAWHGSRVEIGTASFAMGSKYTREPSSRPTVRHTEKVFTCPGTRRHLLGTAGPGGNTVESLAALRAPTRS